MKLFAAHPHSQRLRRSTEHALPGRRPVRQAGQALVLALCVFAAIGVALVMYIARAGLVSEKTRLVTAADNAALAAATWRARAMNFSAYANRAVIAQEVAVAQAVTLAAWASYHERLATTVSSLATVPVGFEFLADPQFAGNARRARELTEQAMAMDIWLRAAPDTGYKSLLLSSQEMLLASAGVFGAGAIANEVARASDPRIFAFALSDSGRFHSFTARQSSPDDRQRFASLVVDSLDSFVVGPRHAGRTIVVADACPGGGLANTRLELVKHGGTRLSETLDRWLAVDTASAYAGSGAADDGRNLSARDCAAREREVWGWGAHQAAASSHTEVASAENPRAQRMALAALQNRQSSEFVAYDGIAAVRDLAESQRNSAMPVTSPVAVLARIDARRLRFSSLAQRMSGASVPALPGDRIWALATAQTYFRNPELGQGQRQGQTELASLFSPFWQARLSPTTDEQRALARGYAD